MNAQLEDQIYFERNLGRDMANLVLSYGDFRCFIVRSRATAPDAKEAPFATGSLIGHNFITGITY